jgi:hypothetical protein
VLYFEFGGEERASAAHAAERFVDYIAEKSYAVTLAVSLGLIKTRMGTPFP